MFNCGRKKSLVLNIEVFKKEDVWKYDLIFLVYILKAPQFD
jgi:hypothetical protein